MSQGTIPDIQEKPWDFQKLIVEAITVCRELGAMEKSQPLVLSDRGVMLLIRARTIVERWEQLMVENQQSVSGIKYGHS